MTKENLAREAKVSHASVHRAAANLYQENIALKKKLGDSRRLASVPAQR
ncbi:MAG: hypothetical protein WB800_06520 [Streptosporangiaceae bacterium]